MRNPIKVIQIGTAHDHAADIYETMLALPEEYEILGVCEPDEALRKRAVESGRYVNAKWIALEEALRTEADAAIIESHEKKLLEYGQMFAERGMAIHMDKPCGDNYAALKKMLSVLEEKHLPFHTGYMYRYNPSVQKCLQWKKQGAFGDIFSVETHMSVRHNAEKRAWLGQFDGGMMFFLGCHLIDLVYLFCGEPLEVIPYNASTMNEGVDSPDYAFAIFRYERGVSYVKTCASEVNGFARRNLVITGTKGTAEIRPLEERTGGENFEQRSPMHVSFLGGDALPFGGQGGEDICPEAQGRYLAMMQSFARIVRGEEENPYTYAHELAVQRLVLQACGAWKGEDA